MKYILMIIIAFTLTSCNAKNEKSAYELRLDSMHNEYVCKAEAVLARYPKRSIEGWMLADAYIECYKKYQIEVPLDLALAQAQLETGFGRYNSTNPYNIRHPKKGYDLFDSTHEGVTYYYDLMCRKYLDCTTWEKLLKKFVNCKGYRYAESRSYERQLKDLIGRYEKVYAQLNENNKNEDVNYTQAD